MFCHSCGKKISSSSKFCKHCGTKIVNEFKPKSYGYVWTCDFCSKEFGSKKLCDEHELNCPDRKKPLLKINSDLLWTTLSWLLIYGFIYLVVNSYATSNGYPSKPFFNPFRWITSNAQSKVNELKIVPTLIPSQTIKPTSIPAKKVTIQKTNTTVNTSGGVECIGPDGKHFNTTMEECKVLNEKWGKTVDYMTNCTMHNNCGGGKKYIKYSECMNGVCCQVGGNWIFYTSSSKCNQDQKNGNVYDYKVPTYTPLSTMKPLPTYSYTAPILQQTAPTVDPQVCSAMLTEWEKIKSEFYATKYNNYSSSADAARVLINLRDEEQKIVWSYGCTNFLAL